MKFLFKFRATVAEIKAAIEDYMYKEPFMPVFKTQQERNDWFNKQSARDKRVLIAKDVIAQLDVNKYRAGCGSYISVRPKDELDNRLFDLDYTDPSEIFEDDTVQCEVCAMGAVLVSRVYLGNHVDTLPEGGSNIVAELKGIFSHVQLLLIEAAFEQCTIGIGYGFSWDKYPEILREIHAGATQMYGDFNRTFHEKQQYRLRSIMSNIIANRGVFVVPGFESECRALA